MISCRKLRCKIVISNVVNKNPKRCKRQELKRSQLPSFHRWEAAQSLIHRKEQRDRRSLSHSHDTNVNWRQSLEEHQSWHDPSPTLILSLTAFTLSMTTRVPSASFRLRHAVRAIITLFFNLFHPLILFVLLARATFGSRAGFDFTGRLFTFVDLVGIIPIATFAAPPVAGGYLPRCGLRHYSCWDRGRYGYDRECGVEPIFSEEINVLLDG